MGSPDVSGLAFRGRIVTENSEGDPIRVMRVLARMNVGGPAWQASALTRAMPQGQFLTRLVCGCVDSSEADFVELRDPNLPVRRIESLGRSVRIGGDFRALIGICREIREFRPHIVHTHTAKAGVLGRIAAVICRVPIRVHTFHGHILTGYFSPLVSRAVRIVEVLLARLSTALVAVGERVRDELIEAGIGGVDKYVVIPPGVALGELPDKPIAREELGIPLGQPVVLFVGRLTGVKRPDRLIEAMTAVLERLPGALLIVAGEGDLLKATRQSAMPIGDSVRFVGWQSDIGRLFAAADVAVLTSDNEGMPVSLIEASFAGVPSVTTAVGSAGEVVLDGLTGRVVDLSAQAVAVALVEILSDAELRMVMGEAAATYAEKAYGLPRLVDDHVELYRRLVREHAIG